MMVVMSSQQALKLKDVLVGYKFDNANYSFTESKVTVVDSRDGSKNQTLLDSCVTFLAGHSDCSVMSNVMIFSNKYWLGLLSYLTPKETWIRLMRKRAKTTFMVVVNRLKEKEPSSENLTIFWFDDTDKFITLTRQKRVAF